MRLFWAAAAVCGLSYVPCECASPEIQTSSLSAATEEVAISPLNYELDDNSSSNGNLSPPVPHCGREHLTGLKGFLFDCDGVIYSWGGLTPGISKLFKWLHEGNIPYGLVSNTLKLQKGVAMKFQRPDFRLRYDIDESRVYTVGAAMGAYMSDHVPPGAKILAFGTERCYDDGVKETVCHLLKTLVPSKLYSTWDIQTDLDSLTTMEWAQEAQSGKYVAVVIAFGDAYPAKSDYEYLSKLSILLRNGAHLIVAGPDVVDSHPRDPQFPNVDTTWPSLGGYEHFFLASAEMFGGTTREATRHVNVGKGGREGGEYMMRPAMNILREQLKMRNGSSQLPSIKPNEVVVIGDNLGTDILAARSSGMRSILVLTGAHQLKDIQHWRIKPTCYIQSAADIPHIMKHIPISIDA